MASAVQRQDVKEWAQQDSPVVEVEGVEQGPEESSNSGKKQEHSSEGKPHVHDTDNIKSTYDVEEDVPPSLFQKMKGRFFAAEDKLRPEGAQHAQNADPHPAMSPAAPGIFSNLHQSIWGKKDEVKPESQAVSETPDSPSPMETKTEVPSPVQLPQGKGIGSNELGTGYEEDSEKGALSSESSLDVSDAEDLPAQPQSLFKPVEAAKDAKDMSLADLRASKFTPNTNTDDVKAPGALDRAKEEVEAVTDHLMESLNLKGKPGDSTDQKESGSDGGFFSRLAGKMGYGGPGRSQSQ